MTGTPAPVRPYPARFLAPLLVGPLLNPINTTMISVALVPISRDLGVASSTVVWLVAGLYLTSAIAQPTLGRVGDVVGPRRVYVCGLLVVLVAGVLPSLLDGFGPVVVSRVLLGLGTSAAYPSVMAMIRERSATTATDTPPWVVSAISISTLTTASVGPVLGGVLIQLAGWRSIFLVNVPLALVALAMALTWVPADRARPTGLRQVLARLDLVGIGLFAVTVATLLVFFLAAATPHWWLLAVAAAAVGCLVVAELRRADPFLDLRMLARNQALTRTYLRMLLLYLGFYSMVYGYSQWLQDDAGFTSSEAGLVQLPTMVLAGVMSVAVARTARVRRPILAAALLPVAGGVLVTTLHSTSQLVLLLVIAAVFGVAQGLASVTNQQVLYRQSPDGAVGTASGLSRTFVYLGAIGSSGVLGATFGESPSDGDLHVVGWLIAACSLAAFLVAAGDRTLRGDATARTATS